MTETERPYKEPKFVDDIRKVVAGERSLFSIQIKYKSNDGVHYTNVIEHTTTGEAKINGKVY